ncbi:MAG: cytochrome c oxidase accessory protein CcoG [Alphaproteobacteria bacterium]
MAVTEKEPASPRPREAAPGVERSSAEAVNLPEIRSNYQPRKKVYAQRAHGAFRTVKWAVMAVTLGIYYLLPWLRWDRGVHLPDQAVLIDFANSRFYFFFLEIWPQEFYFLTGLLVISALVLFLATALAGRVWCGYTCPQTVWTDLMIAVEHFWQGDRNARKRLDKAPWTFDKIWRKGATHLSWLAVSLSTGGAFVFFFRDAPTLAGEFASFDAPAIAYIFLAIFSATTYLLGGIAREQVCTYMCPWPRIQGAMFDHHSLLVSYRGWRGEVRGPHKKHESWEGRGDCIDCMQCVAVCPAGIDIRDGGQLECIQCALCIDACNAIMDRIDRPGGLIAYDTIDNLAAATAGKTSAVQFLRPRVLLYSAMIALVGLIMLVALLNRTLLEVNVQRDRNPLFVALSDGGMRNGYTIKILNKRHELRKFHIGTRGLEKATLRIVGFENTANPVITVVPDDLRALRLYVTVPERSVASHSHGVADFDFTITDLGDGSMVRNDTTFRSPAP